MGHSQVDGSFHSPEWHAARLASLKTSHTVTWEEFKKKQKVILWMLPPILCCLFNNTHLLFFFPFSILPLINTWISISISSLKENTST
jgi:hypothetical protein